MRDTVDATKRVITKEKLDKHLSGQMVNSTPFMKMGDTSHSGKKVSINAQHSIGEKIDNLTSMMYKMSIQQEEGKKPFKPQVYPKRGRGQRRQNFSRNRNNDRQRQNFRQNQNRCRDSNRRGNYRQNFGRNNSRDRGRQNFRRNYSSDRSRSRERSPTPRRYGNRQYNSPNTSSGTRSRSNSRMTMNRDRNRCFRCREYDHFANECPNMGINDSDRYESDSVALQLMTTDIEAHDNYDIVRFTEESRSFKLMKGRNATISFLPKKKKGGGVRFSDKITYIPDREKKYLTKDQAKHIYEMVEMNKPVNIHAMKQGIKDDSKIRVR